MTDPAAYPSGRQLTLRHGDQELVVVEVGGGIRTYSRAGRPVLDGYGAGEMCSGGRGQLLAPWPNRLGDGLYEWEGRSFQTALTEPEHGNAIHGLVRWGSWSVAEPAVGGDEPPAWARLEYRLFPQPGWPWTLDLGVTYTLSEAGLEVRTRVENVSDKGRGPCPFGFGWHPYLNAFGGLVDDTLLTLPADRSLVADERGLPVQWRAVAGTELDFRAGRPIGPARLDTAFTGLTSFEVARTWVTLDHAADPPPSGRVRMWMDTAFTHVMVYSGDTLADPSSRRRGLAIEPMTCAPDMLRSGEGMRILAPGEIFEAAWGIETAWGIEAGPQADSATPSRVAKNSRT